MLVCINICTINEKKAVTHIQNIIYLCYRKYLKALILMHFKYVYHKKNKNNLYMSYINIIIISL